MDPQEELFLKAIHAQPTERVIRLVYADWLEERNDPRAEFIRLEEEMRQVPIYSDRYWEMKPRRNELRPSMKPAWLKSMRYGTDYEPVFRDVPTGWKERWRLIRELIERWHGVPMGDVGGHMQEILDIENNLQCEMPPAIQEWIALAWDLNDQDKYYDVFEDTLGLEEVAGNDAISLIISAEGYQWAVKKTSLSEDDPAVEVFYLYHDSIRHANEWAPHVTTWALGVILTKLEGVGGYRSLVSNVETLAHELSNALPYSASFDHIRLFETTSILAFIWPDWDDKTRIELGVDIWKSLPREEIPDIIWNIPEGMWKTPRRVF